MRVAVLLRCGRGGGAPRSMLTLANHLQSLGHEVAIFAHVSDELNPLLREEELLVEDLDLPNHLSSLLRSVEFPLRFRGRVKRFTPDLVLSQFAPSMLGALLKLETDVPHVTFLRSPTYVGETLSGNSGNRLLDYGYVSVKAAHKQTFRIIRRYTDLFVANSHYTREIYRREWGIRPAVVYPFVDVDRFETGERGDSILHVNPSHHKGIGITLDVARQMSDWQFLVAGAVEDSSIRSEIDAVPNVDHLGHVEDMVEAYGRTKIGLMPSQWDEPYGRIPIEAGSSGIPVLSSGKGGLREAVGSDELIVDSNDSDDYVSKIREVNAQYDRFSNIATENAHDKSATSQVEKFRQVVADRLECHL